MKEENISDALDRIAEEAVPDKQDLWPAIRSRIARPGPGSAPLPGAKDRVLTFTAGRRRLWMGVSAAVVVALVVAAAAPLWNHRDLVDAQAILEHAQATVNGPDAVRTYHLQMTEQAFAKGNTAITTEIWYGGPTLQRNADRVTDGAGAIVRSTEMVFKGDEVWIANTTEGQTQAIHTIGTTWTASGKDPSQQRSLTDALARYTEKTCMDTRMQGDGTVAGQESYVIVLTAKAGGCDRKEPASEAKAEPVEEAAARATKMAGANPGIKGPGDEGKKPAAEGEKPASEQDKKFQMAEPVVAQIVIWVDKMSLLPLKTEVTDASGNVLVRSEVTAVEYNVAIPDEVFTYTAPAGVNVFEYRGGTGADVKMALCRPGPDDECAPDAAGKSSPAGKQ